MEIYRKPAIAAVHLESADVNVFPSVPGEIGFRLPHDDERGDNASPCVHTLQSKENEPR
jgi:hypothetical protein